MNKKAFLITLISSVFYVFMVGFTGHAEIAKAEQSAQSVSVLSTKSLKASETKVSLKEGSSKTVKLTYNKKSLSASKATWSTSNSAVATVKNGKITAKGTGTATVTAKYKTKEAKIQVTVSSSTLKANYSTVTINEGSTKTVKLTFNGDTLSASKATWSTSNSAVATIKDGVITAKATGTATINAKYGGKEVNITVTVNTSTLKANISTATIKKGKTKTVKLTYNGQSLSASKATWSTSKSSIATVKKGVITAKGKGKATITGKYSGKEVKIEVTVN